MRYMVIMKNAIMVFAIVWLSLKIWTTISEIANPTKEDNPTTTIASPELAHAMPPKYHDTGTEEYDQTALSSSIVTSPISVTEIPSYDEHESKQADGNVGVIEVQSTELELGDANKKITNNQTTVETTLSSNESQRVAVHLEAAPSETSTATVTLFNGSTLGDEISTTKAIENVEESTTQIVMDAVNNQQPVNLTYTVNNGTVKQNNDKNTALTFNNGSEIHHVAFLKVHKCGSSTVQNVFLRFGFLRNLTFVLGHDDKKKSETKYVNVISYKQSVTDNNIVAPPSGRHFDILCNHVIYNREQFQKVLPNDTVYIGIVREPVKRLESAIGYFKLFQNVEFSDFVSRPLTYDKSFPSMANNRMAFEFGFPKECFPSVYLNVSFESIRQQIISYLENVNQEFDFIMINERMDESLVYIKRLLRWQLKDILYVTQLSAKQERRKFNGEESSKLKNFLYLDYALYELALNRFEKAISQEGNDFQGEVQHFQDINVEVETFCELKQTSSLVINASQWHEQFVVTQDDCKLYVLFEMTFIQQIRRRQYGSINN